MSTSTTAKTPTTEQLKAYADKLPAIYREILTAMHAADPHRRYGVGIDAQAFWNQLLQLVSEYSRTDYRYAIERLEARGFLEYQDETGFWKLADVGEELMAAVTGKRAPKVVVPDLPHPNW